MKILLITIAYWAVIAVVFRLATRRNPLNVNVAPLDLPT